MSKFIRSRCALEFENPETGEVFRIPQEYLGDVPNWVTKTPLYKLAISGNNPVITIVGAEKSVVVKTVAGVSDEEKELRKKGKILKIQDAAKMPLMELAVAINAIENPPDNSDDEQSDEQSGGQGASGNTEQGDTPSLE